MKTKETENLKKHSGKLPLGCAPYELWLKERRDVLLGCIQRYGANNFKIPHKWVIELNDIINKLNILGGIDFE